ncbi:MAG: hypothetical protein DRO88_06045 [Promethearchaeia archaeon]|nr:MAG: hypothetical protein DRO88_06045 [Candidatus Lokiarchaeia archaeon]
MTENLQSFLERIGDNFTENWANIRDLQSWMMDEIYRKRKTFPFWRKKVRFSYVSWRRKYLKRHPEEKESQTFPNLTRFFYAKFDWLFRYFFENMFLAFNIKQLHLKSVEGNITNPHSDLFFLYRYSLSQEEMEHFIQFKKRYHHPDHYYRIISYIFNSIVMVFSRLISDIIKEKLSFNIMCAKIGEGSENKEFNLDFLIHFQKLDTNFLKSFLNPLIYDFAELLPGIDKNLLSKLYLRKEKLYPMALDAYSKSNAHIVRVFYTLQRKSQVLEHITPLLDITNFIASRVEDSTFNTNQLVHEILIDKAPTLIHYGNIEKYQEIFNYINECASLFSTFQSNNRAPIYRQYQLFFFYCQYFLPLEVLTIPLQDYFYYPKRFNEVLQSYLTSKSTIPKSFPILDLFLFQGIRFEMENTFDRVFYIIFQQNIHEMNENFFASLLKSINQKLHDILMSSVPPSTMYSQYFDEMVHVICVILKNLVSRVFIREKPELVIENFRDNLTRYTPQKIALRVMEMRVFKDVPLADNNWQDYYLSRNKSKVKKTFAKYYDIPDNYFFTEERLLKINMNYERGILKETPLLEDWLIDNILIPFDRFYKKIKKKVGRKTNVSKIRQAIFEEFASGIIDSLEREKLEDIAAYFAELWVARN